MFAEFRMRIPILIAAVQISHQTNNLHDQLRGTGPQQISTDFGNVIFCVRVELLHFVFSHILQLGKGFPFNVIRNVHKVFEKLVGSLQVIVEEGVHGEHVRLLLSKADIVGEILNGFTDERQPTPFFFVDRALNEAQDVRGHEYRAKKPKEEKAPNTCVLAVRKPFYNLSLEMLGDHSERGGADRERAQNDVQCLLALNQQPLHILFHISFGFRWVNLIQILVFLHNRLHEGFENSVKIIFPQNSSERSHQLGGGAIPSKEGGVVLGGLYLPRHRNVEERNEFSIRIQDLHHHLDHLFVARTRHANGADKSKVWVHEHLDEVIFEGAEGIHVAARSLFHSVLADLLKLLDFIVLVGSDGVHMLLESFKVIERFLDDYSELLHQHRPRVSDSKILHFQRVRHHVEAVFVVLIELLRCFAVVQVDSVDVRGAVAGRNRVEGVFRRIQFDLCGPHQGSGLFSCVQIGVDELLEICHAGIEHLSETSRVSGQGLVDGPRVINRGLIVVVNIFRLCHDLTRSSPKDHNAFFKRLESRQKLLHFAYIVHKGRFAVLNTRSCVQVVFTVRAAFFPHLLQHACLGDIHGGLECTGQCIHFRFSPPPPEHPILNPRQSKIRLSPKNNAMCPARDVQMDIQKIWSRTVFGALKLFGG